MAQLHKSRRSHDNNHPRSPQGQLSPTFQQLLQGEAAWQYSTSPAFSKSQHDQEETYSPNSGRKSMFTRVKERAKKLRQSFNVKKKPENEILDNNATPSWGVSLEDEDELEVDEDPEYFGAPMYESELAPEALKESARQHPRANPVVAYSHSFPRSVKHGDENTDKAVDKDGDNNLNSLVVHNKSITEKVSEKLAPACAAVSDATQNIASKIAGLGTTTSVHDEQQPKQQTDTNVVEHSSSSEIEEEPMTTKSSQKWDKGVSVKEYFMNKLEPGEDDKALSQVISEAISPKKQSSDMGVVEKVREAVNSLLRHDEPSQLSATGSASQPSTPEITQATNYPSKIPFVTNHNKVVSPMSSSSPNATSLSDIHVTGRAITVEKPSMKTIKIVSSSSDTPHSPKRGVASPKTIFSRNETSSSPNAPLSLSSSSMEEPSTQRIKAKGLNSPVSISTGTKNTSPNAVSSSARLHSSSGIHAFHTASSLGEHSKMKTKSFNLKTSATTPVSAKTGGVHPPNFFLTNNGRAQSSMPMSRSKSLTSHIHVPNNAHSSPLIPISTNAKEEQAHGRILQAN